MDVNSPNEQPLSSQEIEYLDKLKKIVGKSLEDGKLSSYEMDRIKSMIRADGKIKYERLHTFLKTLNSVMENITPEIEWEAHSRSYCKNIFN